MKYRVLILLLLWTLLFGEGYAQLYSEQGIGKTLQEAKDNALSNLTKRFKASVRSEFIQSKTKQGDDFKGTQQKNLQIKSELTLPNVSYSKAIKRGGRYTVKAQISKNDIIYFIKNTQATYRSLDRYDEAALVKIKKELENILILASVINYQDIESVVAFVNKKVADINKHTLDAKLYLDITPQDVGKDYKLYIDDKLQTIHNHTLYIKPGTYLLTIKKRGYFPIKKRFVFKKQQSRILEATLLQDKPRAINIRIKKYKNTLKKVLKKYKVRIDKNAPYLLQYKIKKRDKNLGGILQRKVTLSTEIIKGREGDTIIETITDNYTYNTIKKTISSKKLIQLMDKNLVKVLRYIDSD